MGGTNLHPRGTDGATCSRATPRATNRVILEPAIAECFERLTCPPQPKGREPPVLADFYRSRSDSHPPQARCGRGLQADPNRRRRGDRADWRAWYAGGASSPSKCSSTASGVQTPAEGLGRVLHCRPQGTSGIERPPRGRGTRGGYRDPGPVRAPTRSRSSWQTGRQIGRGPITDGYAPGWARTVPSLASWPHHTQALYFGHAQNGACLGRGRRRRRTVIPRNRSSTLPSRFARAR